MQLRKERATVKAAIGALLRQNGVRGSQEKEEQEEREQEEQDMTEAAAELVLPEYPVVQLDRADILAAFRSSRLLG